MTTEPERSRLQNYKEKLGHNLRPFQYYWNQYARTGGVFTSLYFLSGFCLACLSFRLWIEPKWWEIPLTILPNLLGFTITAYAVVLALNSNELFDALAYEKNDSISPLTEINVTFVHFILVQTTTLILAILSKGMYFQIDIELDFIINAISWGGIAFGFVGVWLFWYSISMIVSVTFTLMFIGKKLDKITKHRIKLKKLQDDDEETLNSLKDKYLNDPD